MIIRQENSSDFSIVYELIQKAFESAPDAEGDEQDFIERQRNLDSYIPELALVLEHDARLIGHVMLTRAYISTPEGRQPILLLACVALQAEWRSRGNGTALIEEALRRAESLGHAAIILVGEPAYYSRFGFVCSTKFGITNENGFEAKYVQICEILPGALRGISGSIMLPT